MDIQSEKYMTPSLVFLLDEIITEILSYLPVKSLLRFRCVSKYWKTLISDPKFVKLHLKRSETRNPLFTLITDHRKPYVNGDDYYSVVPYPIRHLLDNPSSFTLSNDDPYYNVLNDKECSFVVGSCNGLILFTGESLKIGQYREYWLRLWNPNTRKLSQKFGNFRDFYKSPDNPFMLDGYYKFTFGCDNSTDTYKVVAFGYHLRQLKSSVRILNLGDNVWRDIQSFPVVPLYLHHPGHEVNDGVYLSGKINWLAIHDNLHYNFNDITIEQFVIVSLDLGTKTYNQYLLPRGFEQVPHVEPTICVIGGCLCFSHSYKKTESEFVIWKMQKFGGEESWTQFIRISYQNLQIDDTFSVDEIKYNFQLLPLLYFEDAATLLVILKSSSEQHPILYNRKDNRVEPIKMTAISTITDNRTRDHICWCSTKVYVESLVSII